MTALFEPMGLRGVMLKHRVVISPMCTYHAQSDGLATEWHFVHYGRFAIGGAAMVMLEATSVEERGRHCYSDLGLWSDTQVEPLRRIARFIKSQGSVPAIQLQHAGRKASARRPWHGQQPLDDEDVRLRGEVPWQAVGPSALPYADGKPVPTELDEAAMAQLVAKWIAAARRAVEAGFDVVEIHAAHGYLLNQFLSPISNRRSDRYGGDLQGRMRLVLEIAEAVRAVLPQDKPLFVRISAIDGVEGGTTLDDSVVLARELKARGVDAVDCSAGGLGGPVASTRMPRGPGFQVPFAERIRHDAGIATMAVGLITAPAQAAEIIDNGRADLVAIGRQALVDPNWPNAARTLLRPEQGHAHWPPESGWWLDRRDPSMVTK